MQDIEFTIEKGRLFVLQTRTGKRTAHAALKIAVDMANAGLLSQEEALLRVDPACIAELLHRQVDPGARATALIRGIGASPGAASGGRGLTAADAQAARCARGALRAGPPRDHARGHPRDARRPGRGHRAGRRHQPCRRDRPGPGPALRGRRRRARDRPSGRGVLAPGGRVIAEGDMVTVDGTTGEVLLGDPGSSTRRRPGTSATLLDWADAVRDLGVRANADTPPTPRSPATSAPRASASAAPSTCSSRIRASASCAR